MSRYERIMLDPETGKLVRVMTEPLAWDDVADDFFKRLEEYEEKKLAKAQQAQGFKWAFPSPRQNYESDVDST
jgi:hypothetical protein